MKRQATNGRVSKIAIRNHSLPFPNTKSLAYFVPSSQLIFLTEIRADDIEADFAADRLSSIRHSLSTVYHELTHWADTVGTLWGNDHLKQVYATYDIVPTVNRAGSETRFHRFLDMYDHDRRLSFSEYYRTVEDNGRQHSIKTPWRINFSCGIEFNSAGRPDEQRPVIFVRFGDHFTDQQLVRQPLSIAALLETTATWSELSTQFHTLSALGPDEQTVEEFFLKREYGERLYAPELSLYSAPVHLLAHYAKVQNPVIAYHLGALLSLVCLNLVGSHFRKMSIPTGLEAWGARVSAFKRTQSRPFAFMRICMNAPAWSEEITPIDWVNKALSNSGLPSYDEILSHAVKVLKEDTSICERPKMAKRQKYLRQLGADWLDWRREQENTALDYSHLSQQHLKTPVIFDCTEKPFLLFGSEFDVNLFDPMDMFDEDAALHTQTLNFRRACR